MYLYLSYKTTKRLILSILKILQKPENLPKSLKSPIILNAQISINRFTIHTKIT